jgi:dienelactone hydrolase
MAMTRERLRTLFRLEEPARGLAGSSREERGSYVVERLAFTTDSGERIRGILTRPAGPGPHPAILYPHSHGGEYHIGADELLDGRTYLLSPLGPVFAEAGYVTLMLDMPTFGERAHLKEASLSKALLWHGKSLIGQMLAENAAALTWLCTRPDVDPARIGMFGISMGCTLSYWLAAVDDRVAAVAHLCCYADLDAMIETGAHDGHGIYLTVPGLLEETSNGEIAGLVAPRPQLICLGDADSLTPPAAVDRALAITRPMYGAGPLEIVREPGIRHQETARMRTAVLGFFHRSLGR